MKRKLLLAALCVVGALGFKANAQSWTGNAPAEGTFFLYNVEAGKFINNGDPNQEWGTNAYLQAGFGLDFQLELNNGAYNLNTNVSNGGNKHYLGTSTWCDGDATPWTFTAVDGQDNTYTISNGGKFLVANDALDDIIHDASTNDSKSWWKLVSLDDFKAAMQAKTYSATAPMDVSVFIQGRSFARNDGRNDSWTTTHNGGNWVWIGVSANKYYGNEAWNNTFSVSQTIQNLPDGTYELKCSGFGTNGTTYIFANNTLQAIQSDNTTSRGTSKEAKWTAIHEDNAFAGQTTGKFTLSGGTLNLGLKRENNTGGDWCVYDEFRLYYYGLDLSEFAATLAAAVTAAEAVEGTVPTAAYNALASVVTENNKTYTTAAEYTAAANAIVEATNTAKALQANYTRYNSVKNAALAINANLNTATPDAEVAAATTNDAIDGAIAKLRAAFLAALPNVTVPAEGLDVTSVMVDNASVSENTNYWTIANLSENGGSAGVCNYGECEFYNRNFKFYQTLALTPGTWEFGVTGFHRAGNHKTDFYAGEDKILIPGVANTVVNTMAQAKEYFDAGNGKVALKFLVEDAQNIEIGIDNQDTETDKWTIFRNFTLKYFGEPDYSVYETQWAEAVAAADEALTTNAEYDKFVATEKTALTTAKADVPTPAGKKAGYVAKINALKDATSAYTDACRIFASAKDAIAKANAVKENHNFDSAEATATFAAAIKEISDKYDAGTLTSEEAAAAGTTLGVVVTNWRANPNGAAVKYMNDGFSIEGYVDNSLYVNTWSVEGDNDGTGFSVPFFEYWVGSGNLTAKTWTGTLTDMPNGQYKVSAWVRVSGGSNATGVTMGVNEGDAVDVTEGEIVNNFNIATYEAIGLVKDGTLTLNVNVADGNTTSWLSFKNVKYTKVRDLTPEEEIVYATDDDYAVLESTINAAEEKVLGFEIGDYAPYNNVEALAALKAAKAIDPTVQNVQEDVQAAANALGQANWTANTEEVNAVYDGTFAAATNNGAPAGWTMSNNTLGGALHSRAFNPDEQNRLSEFNSTNSGLFLRFDGTNSNRGSMYYYGDTDGYTMPLKANTTYYAKVDFAGWGSTGKPLRMNVTGPEGFTAQSQQFNTSVRADNADNEPQQFLIVFTTTVAGNYVINFQTPGSDDNKHNVVVSNIELLRAQSVELAVDANAKYGTFVAPFDVTIPEGVIAYTVEAPKEGNVLTLNQEEKISANKPVLLYAENGYDAKPVYGYAKPENEPKNGLLTGTYEPNGAIAPTGSYVLQLHDGNTEPAFYRVESDATFVVTVPANRAYLTLPDVATANVRTLFFSAEGEATGIAGLEVLTSGNYDAIYTAGGAKVESLQKGLNIVVKDGKSYKIFVK